MRVVGIDPGKSGAIAVVCHNSEDAAVWDMPTVKVGKTKEAIVAARLKRIIADAHPDLVVIERVHSMPKQGVASMFSFGYSCGLVEGVVAALGLPYIFVTPQAWKKVLLASLPKDGKDSSRLVATQLWPHLTEVLAPKTKDGRADALLIAEYGLRMKPPTALPEPKSRDCPAAWPLKED